MTLKGETKFKNDNYFKIDKAQLLAIEHYLQGAVYCWIKNIKEEFAARDFAGGENYNWKGTPLQCLYDYYICAGEDKEYANKRAAVDLGWILKNVLKNDIRVFKPSKGFRTKKYTWVQ